MIFVTLATEDEISEQVGVRLVEEAGLEVAQYLRRGGFGYLKSRMDSFCEMAATSPVLLITDLDRSPCAANLVGLWFGRRRRPKNLLLRVAVKEVESWLLADHDALKSLLGGRAKLPELPDNLDDPKRELLKLAMRAPRSVREDLVAQDGAIASQGIGYNSVLSAVVRTSWSPTRAAGRSPSLARARIRISELAQSLA